MRRVILPRRFHLLIVAVCLAAADARAVPQESGGVRAAKISSASAPVEKKDTAGAAKSPELAVLQALVGPWRLKESHYNDRGEVIASVTGTEEIKWILDGHALQRVYISGGRDPVFRAIGTLTWNPREKAYVGVWFDNQSQVGPTSIQGEWREETRSFIFSTDTVTPEGRKVRLRIVEQLIGEKHRLATTYVLDGSEVIKRMVVEYERSIPCPSHMKPRVIMDDFLGVPK